GRHGVAVDPGVGVEDGAVHADRDGPEHRLSDARKRLVHRPELRLTRQKVVVGPRNLAQPERKLRVRRRLTILSQTDLIQNVVQIRPVECDHRLYLADLALKHPTYY